MRRGRYLKQREELVAVRSVDEGAEHGAIVVYNRLKAVVTRRIYAAQSTRFDLGLNVPEEQYALNIKHDVDPETGEVNKHKNVVAGNQVILGVTEETTDLDILQEERRVLTVKSPSVGVNLTRLNCIEL